MSSSPDRDRSPDRYSYRKRRRSEEHVSRNQLGTPEPEPRDRRGYASRDTRDYRNRDYDRSSYRDRGRRYDNRNRDRSPWDRRTRDRRDRDDEDKENRRENRRHTTDKGSAEEGEIEEPVVKKQKDDESLTTKTGGAYIPPARLRMMQAAITDKTSVAYQRISWEALKKSLNGLINKVNISNIAHIVRELFQENIVRGRGLLTRSVIQAQTASPTFSHVYSALVGVINTKFPQIGELLLKRLIIQFKRGFRRNDKTICLTATRFLAHLVNQQVAHEVIALEVLTLLLESPTDDSVEVAVGFLKECGQKLTEVSPRGIQAIFERLRNILHESSVDKRVQYMIEVMFAVRKDGFKDHPSLVEDLDLVEEDDQFTHLLTLDEAVAGEEMLNVFKADPDFEENENKYKTIKREILEEDSSDESGSGSGSGSGSDSDDEEAAEENTDKIVDMTETNLIALRRTIYLTIQSSLDFEESAHKLLKMQLKPGQEYELMAMIMDCCAQMRTYEKFFGLLAQRFCMLDKKYVAPCETMFQEQFETCHRLETSKLRNVAKFFAHLLFTDSVSWGVLQCIRMTEEDTTSSSRIFIKILFQELSEYMGLTKLNERLTDVTLVEYFDGLFPRDHPKNVRFSINFFTTIGLGGLTDDLREFLKTMPKMAPPVPINVQSTEDTSSSSSSSSSESSSDSDSSSSSSSSSSSDSSSDSEPPKSKKRAKKGSDRKKVQEAVEPAEKTERNHARRDSKATRDRNNENVRDRDRRNRDAERNGQHEESKERRGERGRDKRNDKQLEDERSDKQRGDKRRDEGRRRDKGRADRDGR